MFDKDKLESIMIEKGWTKYRLAKEAGLGQSTVHELISGKKASPTATTLSKLADALGVSVNDFFDEEDKDFTPKEKINKLVKDSGIETVAAHFEGEEFTEDDLDDIENFIKFVISKKKKK